MTTYILSAVFAAVFLLIAAIIANAINYEGGVKPKDPGKRKLWFWIFAILNPAIFFVVCAFLLAPEGRKDLEDWNSALPIATGISFVLYVLLGFILSKIFKNGKLGNWF